MSCIRRDYELPTGYKMPCVKNTDQKLRSVLLFFAVQFYQYVKLYFPLDPELKRKLQFDGCFLHPERYDPVKFLGAGGFAKVL